MRAIDVKGETKKDRQAGRVPTWGTSRLSKTLMAQFNELAKKTRLNKSHLLDEAVEDLLKKYEKRLAE